MNDLAFLYHEKRFFWLYVFGYCTIAAPLKAAFLMAASSITAHWMACPWMSVSGMAASWVAAPDGDTLQQNSLRRKWISEQLSGLFIHATSTPTWPLKPVKFSTSFELYPAFFWLLIILDSSGIQFFHSHPFPNTVN